MRLAQHVLYLFVAHLCDDVMMAVVVVAIAMSVRLNDFDVAPAQRLVEMFVRIVHIRTGERHVLDSVELAALDWDDDDDGDDANGAVAADGVVADMAFVVAVVVAGRTHMAYDGRLQQRRPQRQLNVLGPCTRPTVGTYRSFDGTELAR